MATSRGSRQKLKLIKEVTYGTTPATPTMLEIPINSLTPTVSVNAVKSAQIRSHPFVDRLMKGPQSQTIDINTELQDANHDALLELLCGANFASGSVSVTDALKGASIESDHADNTLLDQFTGFCITKGDFTFPAQVGGIVTANYSGMAKTGLLDQGVSIATAVTAAGLVDPYTFNQAAVTINGVARPVTSLTFSLTRTIDPLYLLGGLQPDEYIPSDVTLTGQLVIPLRDAVESTRLVGFVEAPLVATCTNALHSFVFTMPKINYSQMGRPIQGRGAILQTIDFEAKYDGTATVMTIAKT